MTVASFEQHKLYDIVTVRRFDTNEECPGRIMGQSSLEGFLQTCREYGGSEDGWLEWSAGKKLYYYEISMD